MIQEATNGEVSVSPAEPYFADRREDPNSHDGHGGHRGGAEPSPKRQVLELAGGDVELAKVLWERHGGDLDAIRAEIDAEAAAHATPAEHELDASLVGS